MRYLLSTITLILISLITSAQVKVKGYYRKNGTYVQPHYRSNPDGNPYNNYSYPGNVNPYTGKVASGNPDTYLNNYYNRNTTSNSNNLATYNYARTQLYRIRKRNYSYTSYSLYSANYYQVATTYTRYSYYKINDSYGYQVGYTSSKNYKTYKIYDNSGTETGLVKMTRNGYYTVYDNSGHKLYSNKPRGSFAKKTIGIIGVIGLIALISY
jgi:hypothetical protein